MSQALEVRLRRLRREDIPAAACLAREAFACEATGALVRRMLTVHCDTAGEALLDEQAGAMLATEYYALCDRTAGDLVGLSGLYRTAWTDSAVCSLGWFCVAPARQGQGLGRLLLEATLQIAVRRGARRLVIETSPDTAAALRLYRRLGFEECGRIPDGFGPGIPQVLLTRSLEGARFDTPEGVLHVR